MQPSDTDIIRQCVEGDIEAFSGIVDKYKKKVYGIAYGITNNCDCAEEISQEVFIRVYRSLSGFRGQSAFSTWLYRITVNCSINHIKRLGRSPEVYLDDIPPPAAMRALSTEREAPDARLMEKEFRTAFAGALSALNPKHRTAFALHEIEGLSIEAIAEITGARKGTVKSRLHYAREKMRRMLSSHL